MKTQQVSATALIQAPAKRVYDIIADYREGHLSILPKQYFGPIEILKGGVGAGTQTRFTMTAPGSKQTFIGEITEPEAGRVLVESNYVQDKPSVKSATTFTVESIGDGKQAQVTFTTEVQVSNWLEGFFTSMFLRRVYKEELKQLEVAAKKRSN